jgi:hypothetical protein
MHVRIFRWLFVAFLALEIVASYTFSGEPQPSGVSAEWANDAYHFAGGTAPWALGFAVLIASLYILIMDAAPVVSGAPLPGLLRRFAAFSLDFMLAMFMVAPMVGLIPLFFEWKRTRVFAWTFTRTTSTAFDIPVTVVSMLLTVVGLLFYYSIPILRRRPSPGSCILGYQVLPDGENPLTLRRAMLRSVLGFIAVSGAYVAPFVARDQKHGKFWLDRVFGTRASLLP